MNELKVGDTVILKSGGPEMTIESYGYNVVSGGYYNDRFECIWFDDSVLKRSTFMSVTLEKA